MSDTKLRFQIIVLGFIALVVIALVNAAYDAHMIFLMCLLCVWEACLWFLAIHLIRDFEKTHTKDTPTREMLLSTSIGNPKWWFTYISTFAFMIVLLFISKLLAPHDINRFYTIFLALSVVSAFILFLLEKWIMPKFRRTDK